VSGRQPRSLGALQLNDWVNTFYSYEVPPGTDVFISEQRARQNGDIAPIGTDREGAVITVHMTWIDGNGGIVGRPELTYWDFLSLLRANAGQAFDMGDGQKYAVCWAPSKEITVARVVVRGTNPARRGYDLTLNIHSLHADRVPV
jgi:hypothetical protein